MDYYSAQEEQVQAAIALLREKLEQVQDDSSSRLTVFHTFITGCSSAEAMFL